MSGIGNVASLQDARWKRVFWAIAGLVPVTVIGGWTATYLRRLAKVGMQEDAMIGMRHLRNFIEGNGLVYNAGEGAVGVTDPLFWLGSALFHLLGKLFGSTDLFINHYVYVWGVVVAAVALLAGLARGPRMALSAGFGTLLLAACFSSLRFMFMGLEGPFLLLSVALVGWLHRRASPEVFYFAAAFLSWNRPETAIAALPLLVFFSLFRCREHGVVRALAPVAVGGALFPLGLWLWSGSPIVQTVLAKSYFGSKPPLTNLSEYLSGRMNHLSAFIDLGPRVGALVVAAVLVIAAFDFFRFLLSKEKSLPSAATFYSVFCVGYTAFVVMVPNLWEWYITYWLGFVLVLFAGRLAALVDVLTQRWSRFQPAVVVVALVVLAGLVRPLRPIRHSVMNWTEIWLAQESAFRGRIGRELASEWQAKSVWMEAVGWQGYFNNARVFDEVGLVDRETPLLAKKFKCRYFISALLELKPQFVIKRRFEVERNRLMIAPRDCPEAPLFETDEDRAQFFQRYELVKEYTTETPEYFGEYSYLQLYRLRDSITQG
ncbi:hypothetical protein GCM10012319_41700 [Comamonas sp. KCTC 72670]|nr:hypothetical protein GCM10012319_41700 [Comamonas sp. KCTC 72670]